MIFSEIFKGFQGEGLSQGRHSLFIRFYNCNLTCKDCDSKYTWKDTGENKETRFLTLIPLSQTVNNVVLTGGEPLIDENYKFILKYITKLEEVKWNGNIEIETNGTIRKLPITKFDRKITFNISPKQNFEQLDKEVSTEPVLLKELASNMYAYNYCVKYLFKDKKDLRFIREQQMKYNLLSEKIWVQPIGVNEDDIKKIVNDNYKDLLDWGWSLSSRLHILLFGNKRGV
jgi:7-carboxy-7-deazaguanine synthase